MSDLQTYIDAQLATVAAQEAQMSTDLAHLRLAPVPLDPASDLRRTYAKLEADHLAKLNSLTGARQAYTDVLAQFAPVESR